MLSYASSPETQRKRGQIPEIGFCEEKTRLLNEFLRSIQEINMLHSQQMRAVIEGDPDFGRFDTLLYFAQEDKDSAKYAWISHVESHGCGG